MKKRVLIISYYWPPAGGGGVQRWLKMTKYLPEMGFDVLIYTPKDNEVPVMDESLVSEVNPKLTILRTPIWEPYSWYKKLTGRKKGEKVYSGFISDKGETWTQKLSVFIRGNFFIPDARKFWIKPSTRFLTKYIKENPVDMIISTGPPHSTHLIALAVTRQIKTPWIADFRDPWTNIDFYNQLRLTSWADRKHKSLEQMVLKNATKVVTVSESWASDFKALSGRDDVVVIPNGYDQADFGDNPLSLNPVFTLCHIGSMNKDRNPSVLWQALKELLDEKAIEEFKIRLIGQVDLQIFNSIDSFGLSGFMEHISFMDHDKVILDITSASLLLLPINDTPNSAGVIPGKLFEYMGSGRPILGIGPLNGDSATILNATKAGEMIDYLDLGKMKKVISEWYGKHQADDLTIKSNGVSNYSRENLAAKYAALINDSFN
jgi:glycosyltransferase involved in cell wall biosynthesis